METLVYILLTFNVLLMAALASFFYFLTMKPKLRVVSHNGPKSMKKTAFAVSPKTRKSPIYHDEEQLWAKEVMEKRSRPPLL